MCSTLFCFELNISALSFGALSKKNTIMALNLGLKEETFFTIPEKVGLPNITCKAVMLECRLLRLTLALELKMVISIQKNLNNKQLCRMLKLIEIKLSQGAKPAHGGMLPKEK